jgi:DNA modification methylase
METRHRIIFSDSRDLSPIDDESIDLVVTSPPYPMIEMWDDLFTTLNPEIGEALKMFDGTTAADLMNQELDKVWSELARVVKQSGFVCINIGDATRTIGNQFQLYSNHSRITSAFVSLGFQPLPIALWKKSTNAPNKFMGSGMLPVGAYITLEHEYILVFRKGGKRAFKTAETKIERSQSAFFWEERNTWFSDTWDLKGARQATNNGSVRERNAAYPFNLPYRLINMYSVVGDTVLDPFLGTGTSTFAAITAGRNSVGIEFDGNFSQLIREGLINLRPTANAVVTQRIKDHLAFCDDYQERKGDFKYRNEIFGFPVMTRQEIKLELHHISKILSEDLSNITAYHEPIKYIAASKSSTLSATASLEQSDGQLPLFG